MSSEFDAIVIGGGHNGLVAACYLAKSGKKVVLLEKRDHLGGATQSAYAFAGIGAKLSRYSYLVALLPDQIVQDLELNFEALSRKVSSYTPWNEGGVLINRNFDEESRKSIDDFVGNESESENWLRFYSRIANFAELIAPTLLQPVPSEAEIRSLVGAELFREFVEQPLSETLSEYFQDDVIKGIVLTDALIGTFASAEEELANVCFLYHLIGNGSGEWRVPKGGMGALVETLTNRARELGVEIRKSSTVTAIVDNGANVSATLANGEVLIGKVALANCSPVALEGMSAIKAPAYRDGSQVKINMVLDRLPRLKSGIDPRIAFAGTFHINESYSQLQRAFQESSQGKIPAIVPAEVYCHTLTDTSILDQESRNVGRHTLTLFALHTPASLFEVDHDRVKAEVTTRIIEGLNSYLLDPIESCLSLDREGRPCIEVKTPQELESEIDLPRGNIFHGDLRFPWHQRAGQGRWGVETSSKRILIAGASALRGGGVSGIPGQNAARAALELM